MGRASARWAQSRCPSTGVAAAGGAARRRGTAARAAANARHGSVEGEKVATCRPRLTFEELSMWPLNIRCSPSDRQHDLHDEIPQYHVRLKRVVVVLEHVIVHGGVGNLYLSQ